MPEFLKGIVPVFLAAQALLVYGLANRERPPAPPGFANFTDRIGNWLQYRENPIAPDVRAELQADELIDRSFADPSSNQADLLIAWFQTQRGGARQPHSPKVCLPGAGWHPEISDEIALPTALGTITVNRYVAVKDTERSVILYWYQTSRRTVADEWAAKFWLVADAVRDRRSDAALIRVAVPSLTRDDRIATRAAINFAAELYPELRAQLSPHTIRRSAKVFKFDFAVLN